MTYIKQSDLNLFNFICSNSSLAQTREARDAISRIYGVVSRSIAESNEYTRERPLLFVPIDGGYQVGEEGNAKTIYVGDRSDFLLLHELLIHPGEKVDVTHYDYKNGASARASLTRFDRSTSVMHMIHKISPSLSGHLHRSLKFSDRNNTAAYLPDYDEPILITYSG